MTELQSSLADLRAIVIQRSADMARLESTMDHFRGDVEDHESRLRPLERQAAQVAFLAALGAMGGGGLVFALAKLFGGG